MQTSQNHRRSAGIYELYPQPAKDIQPFRLSHISVLDNKLVSDTDNQGMTVSFQTYKDQFFTLESSTTSASYNGYDVIPVGTISSGWSPYSSRHFQPYLSDPHHYVHNTNGSSSGGSSTVDYTSPFKHKLSPTSDSTDSCNCCFKSRIHQSSSTQMWNRDQLVEMIPRLDLKQVLTYCAKAVSDNDLYEAASLMNILDHMVSVSGDPISRLGAYFLEGLRARLESSGSCLYEGLKCKEPTSSELSSYMSVLFQFCPYWKFAYSFGNAVIKEAMEDETQIHIIDFQIAQGTQYTPLIQEFGKRPGGPPLVRITGLDDSQSKHARGGGLHIVGERLSRIAESCNVPFEFHDATMSSCDIEVEHLRVQPGYALAVSFPYMLHHVPDESVSLWNHRDRLLRLVKSLSPKVVTLVEQQSNTNTSPFFLRFVEMLDYYTAMFESIDVGCRRDDKKRIDAEQHCVARDIVNMIACEGPERVERHELFGKWKARLMMAGFTPCPLSTSVTFAVNDMLNEYNNNYRLEEKDGALYLHWKLRAMSTSSAWR